MRKRSIRAISVAPIAIVASVGLLLTGCATSAPEEPSSKADVKTGGTLRMLFPADTSALDPTLSSETIGNVVSYALFDTLVMRDGKGEVFPAIATEWKISDDGLVYDFTIREGVKFHDGSPLTANDVKFSIERLRDTPAAPSHSNVSMVKEVVVNDDTSVTFNLDTPYSPLLGALSDVSSAIVPEKVVTEQGDLKKKPVGSGPFMLESWRQGQEMRLIANPNYWQNGKPYLDGITITYNGDTNARLAALRSGNVDFLYKAPNEVAPVLMKDPSIKLVGGDAGAQSFQYFQVNPHKPPFDNPLMREAIKHALDNEAISALCLPDSSTPLKGGFMSPKYWAGADKEVFQFDKKRTKELLGQIGYDASVPFKINVPANYLDYFTCASQAVQAQLKEAGINSEVNAIEIGQYLEANNTVAYDTQIGSWSAASDPDFRFGTTFMTDGGANWTHYSDSVMDDYVREARLTTDRDERGKLYKKAQEQLSKTGPWHFIYSFALFDAHKDYVQGFKFKEAVNYHGYEDIWLDK